MTTTFIETPDATQSATIGTNIWSGVTGSPTVSSDFVHGRHVASYKYTSGGSNGFSTANGVLSDTGSRISFYYYFVTLPGSSNAIAQVQTSGGGSTVVYMMVTSAGVIQLNSPFGTQIGTDGPTLTTGNWYRISLAYTITSTTVNRFELFVGGISGISITNATLSGTGSSRFLIGASNTTLIDSRSNDHYIDNSSSLTDTGDVWVTAKRPIFNGTSIQWTTQIGSGGSGYGNGHTPQINERPVSVTNGWSINSASLLIEEYTIEGKKSGDIDISTSTLVDMAGWVYIKVASASTGNIIVSNSTNNISVTNSAKVFNKIIGSIIYPTGNTDIGVNNNSVNQLFSLYDCGIVVAYIPPATYSSPLTHYYLSQGFQ